jgi:hypothetical protein
MRSHRAPLGALLLATGIAIASCGEVPTLENGIAYITPVLLPSPAVAIKDTLRDSLGVARPLRIQAFGRDSQEITGLSPTFLPTVLPSAVRISPEGYVIADTGTGSVQIVGRIGDRLQTSPVTLLVVPQPLSIVRASSDASNDSALALPALKPMPVTVSGQTNAGTFATVNGIIVRYRIDSLFPKGLPKGSAILTNAAGASLRPDSTIAVDTTKSGGTATRNVLVLTGSGVDSVFVSAAARQLTKGAPLVPGSPVSFVLRVKK